MAAATPIYLDNNSTTPLDPRVLAEMLPVFERHHGNPSSVTHAYGWYADEMTKIARERTASLLGCEAGEVIFTGGGTESNNLVLFGVARALQKRGVTEIHMVTAATEHRAVLDPLRELESQGVKLTVLPVDRAGRVTKEQLLGALRPSTALVSLMLANNEIGTIHPVRELADAVRSRGVLFHSDAVQAIGKIPVHVAALGVDFLSVAAHKFYGPKGVGAVFIGKERGRSALEPWLFGGGHESGLRSGTLNVPGIVGLGKAAEFAETEGPAESARLRKLSARLLARLRDGALTVVLNGPEERLPGNLNLSFPGVESAVLVGRIQTRLALSVGSACQSASKMPSHVLSALGLDAEVERSAVRLGIGRFTTEEEVEKAADALISVITEILATPARHS